MVARKKAVQALKEKALKARARKKTASKRKAVKPVRKNPVKQSRRTTRSEKGFWGKLWFFLWYDDSLASWLVNIILAFVIIKFLLYPGLGFVLGTPYPVVAVVSSSMEHHPGNFDQWWAANEDYYLRLNITKFEFKGYAFRNGFNKGDIMILAGVNPDDVEKGTIIVYWSSKPYPIIHRFVGYHTVDDQTFLTSKGDNNPAMIRSFELDEYRIPPDRVVGKAILRVPFLGYVKIWVVDAYNLLVGA